MLGLEESPDFQAPGLNSLGRSCCRRSPNTAGFGTRSNVRRSMAPGIRYQSAAGSRSTRIRFARRITSTSIQLFRSVSTSNLHSRAPRTLGSNSGDRFKKCEGHGDSHDPAIASMCSARYCASTPTPESRPDLMVCIQWRPRK